MSAEPTAAPRTGDRNTREAGGPVSAVAESAIPGDISGGGVGFTHRQIMVVMGGLMTALLLAALDQTIVSTALYTIVGDIGGPDGVQHISWIVTAYLLASTASTPLYGKVSDIYGRKPLFLFAISVFLVGSVLAGLSQNMLELTITRGIQGIGAGGLMSLAMAIVGDVIPPRDRGRYQGLFGAVFGLSSVAGPLLGGFFTQSLSWRWIFYINIPLGAIALFVVIKYLHIPHNRRQHAIDWTGATLLVAAVSLLLLGMVNGQQDGWTSSTILGYLISGGVLTAAFLWWENRVAEPILPLTIFRDRVIGVTSLLGFIVGFAMFGAIVYLPIYLQAVKGSTPTMSGLQLLPLMVGLLLTTITSGRLITRLGRYKIFPVLGAPVLTAGFWLFHLTGVDTPLWQIQIAMFVVGLGIGGIMQVVILAAQNAAAPHQMGVVTSTATFVRGLGGTFGTTVFGVVLNNTFASELATRLPGAAAGHTGGGTGLSAAALASLPPAVRAPVLAAFTVALDHVFLVAAGISAVAFVLALLLPERPLRTGAGQAPAAVPVEL